MGYPDAFSALHPAVNFLCLALVLGFTMFTGHPGAAAVSLVCAAAYCLRLNGWRGFGRKLAYLLPLALLAALLNPLFSHRGATVLAYFPSGNPLTWESILYGLGAAAALAAALLWFSCAGTVLTSDKFVYLFGRFLPALSLVLSMALGFVPRFAAQFRAVRQARQGLGREPSGRYLQRLRHTVALFSIMVTWSLEQAVDTADSMRSRGYGLPGRTAFSIYPFRRRDRMALLWLALCGLLLLGCTLAGGFTWRYYPTLRAGAGAPLALAAHLLLLALCLTPLIIDGEEELAWRRSRSGI